MESREEKSILKHLDFILADLLILEGSYLLANVIRYLLVDKLGIAFDDLYRHQSLILVFCLVVSLMFGNPYQDILKRNKYEEFSKTFRHALYMFLVDVICLFFIHEAGAMSRMLLIFTWIFYLLIEFSFRLIWKRYLREKYLRKDGRRAMIVLTDSEHAKELTQELLLNPFCGFFIAGVFLTDSGSSIENTEKILQMPGQLGGIEAEEIPILGGAEELISYANHNWVDEVFLDLRSKPDGIDRITLISALEQMGIPIHVLLARLRPDREETRVLEVNRIANYVVTSSQVRDVSQTQWFVKRAMDILGGLLGCILTGIFIILIGPAIYLKSPGNIFFSQERIGKNGKAFRMYKFRSMYPDAEKQKQRLQSQNKMSDERMFKMEDDPRIIGSEKKDATGRPRGIGNFIRRTSIDEFPQFFNVLRGDMSLVGTRPPTRDEWVLYAPKHRARMSMRPGITGMWQISGRSNITDFEQVVELDLQYIQNWTIGMDIRILWRTIKVVLGQNGAR